MKSIFNFCVTGFLTAVALSGCATKNQHNHDTALAEILEKRNLVIGDSVRSIYGRMINSWEYIDQHSIILEARINDYYLIEFSYPCIGINSSFTIGYTSTGGSVTPFDKIVFKDFGRREECRIKDIIKLEERATDDSEEK